MSTENRDMACASEVGRMAELGRFETELNIYGCAYLDHGRIVYRLSERALPMYHFVYDSVIQERFTTSVRFLSERTLVPAGMAESLSYKAKLELAIRLRDAYPRAFFEALAELGKMTATNAALPFLTEMAHQIDGLFDESALQLFDGTLMRCIEGKLLDRYYAEGFRTWLSSVRRQMENDPMPGARFKRTLYGFCYESEGKIRAVLNAVAETVAQEHTKKQLQGLTLGPILERTYWLENFGEMGAARQDFKNLLLTYESKAYFELLGQLHKLPTMIDESLFYRTLTFLEESGVDWSIEELCRYGKIWNVI